MISKVHSAGLSGVEGYLMSVECFYSGGLPRLDIVGLPDKAVSESGERVRAAVKTAGYDWPPAHIVINLAPADTRKEGSAYDLPILLSILAATGQIDPPPADAVFLGELSLGGAIRPVPGVLSMLMAAREAGCATAFVPRGNAEEAAYIADVDPAGAPMTIYAVDKLADVLDHLGGLRPLDPCPPPAPPAEEADAPDFQDVLGQAMVKRALEVAAAGGHNVLLSGSPGAGKSMLAKRLPSILPPLTPAERLEVIRIWSVNGEGAAAARRPGRPFRAPHHTTSAASIAGGGSSNRLPRPGEISLAHRGVLFLDELPEFHRDVIEALRQPIENGTVTISRVAGKVTYPAGFQLVAAMNPCRCGWYGTDRCTCTRQEIRQYLRRLSGPLLDRIDLQIPVQPVPYGALADRSRRPGEPSAVIRERVIAARALAARRYAGTGILCNAAIPPARLADFCPLDAGAREMLGRAFDRLGLTARAHDRVLRVARTVADLEAVRIALESGEPGALDRIDPCAPLESADIAEALRYRAFDKKEQQFRD